VRHRSAPFCARTSPQRPQAREQRARDLESLVTRLLAAHGPARASIPVVGVTQVAFDAVQPGADPRAFGVVLRLRELVRGRPVAVQAVPDGAQHWRRTGWRVATTEAANERIDGHGHRAIPRNRRAAARLT